MNSSPFPPDIYIKRLFVKYQVYDVSSYLDEHPGGDDVILAATGIFLHFQSHEVKLHHDKFNLNRY